jgi:hypothetical protein
MLPRHNEIGRVLLTLSNNQAGRRGGVSGHATRCLEGDHRWENRSPRSDVQLATDTRCAVTHDAMAVHNGSVPRDPLNGRYETTVVVLLVVVVQLCPRVRSIAASPHLYKSGKDESWLLNVPALVHLSHPLYYQRRGVHCAIEKSGLTTLSV